MPVIERPAFIATLNPEAYTFIRNANLTLVGDVARMPSREQVKTSADIFLSRIPPEEREQTERAWIIADYPGLLIASAQLLIAEGKAEREVKEFFPKLIVIELGSTEPKDYIDQETGIRVAAITNAQIKRSLDQRMHPTPNS